MNVSKPTSVISQDSCHLRPLAEGDLALVLDWRNSDAIRAVMYTDHRIAPAEHAKWFARLQTDESAKTFLFVQDNVPTGIVNFTAINATHRRADWGFYIGNPKAPKGS